MTVRSALVSPPNVGDIVKFVHISSLIKDSLCWIPNRQHIQFNFFSLMQNCFAGSALLYLRANCTPVYSLPSRSALQSSTQGHLVVPHMCTSMAQSRSFAFVGPSIWNRLPRPLRLTFLRLSFE